MADTLFWIMSIIGPVVLLLVLVWLVFLRRSRGTDRTTYQGTTREYEEEERRRRSGTDDR